MTEFWFDSNFFIVAREVKKVPLLKRLFGDLRAIHQFKLTKRIRDEIHFFNETIRLFFKTITLEKSPEFQNFCNSVRYCLKNSKTNNEPADQSLAFAAAHSNDNTYIVTNDEGFTNTKKIEQTLMSNVQIIEPMEFFEMIMPELTDINFKGELEKLIVIYADHFIKHRLRDPNNPRPIESILENLLLYSSTTFSLTPIKTLPDDLRILLKRFMSNEILTPIERNKIKHIKKFLMPFGAVYSTENTHERDLLVKSLYLQMPELLSEFKDVAINSQEEIFKYENGIQELIERELLRIRIEDTIHYFQDCLFDEAYLHFSPILETNWCFSLKKGTIQDLKLLYGIFQLNFGNFDFIRHLMEVGFWEETSEVKKIFTTLLDIKDYKIIENINDFSKDDLTLLYNLGLFFCNTGNLFGLLIFDTLFNLSLENLEQLKWRDGFVQRYILELRINQKELTENMRCKFLSFLQERDLEDNTKVKFDRSRELPESTSIEDANYLFRQPFFFMRAEEQDHFYKTYCWNNAIRSIIILTIPIKVLSNLKNVRSILILSGNIKTRNVSPKEKKNARIIIELEENCNVNLERFKLNIFNN